MDYQNSNTWVNIYYKNKMLNMPEKEWLVFSAITHLILTESLYHQVVNILCYARVHSKVPPLHDEKLENHTEFEGISKIELSKKQKFLHDECPELVDACNLNLRNSVAHMRFCLVPDLDPIHERHKTGTSYSSTTKVHTKKHDFYLFKKENGSWKRLDSTPTDLRRELDKLMKVTYSWHTALLHYQAKKWFEESSHLSKIVNGKKDGG